MSTNEIEAAIRHALTLAEQHYLNRAFNHTVELAQGVLELSPDHPLALNLLGIIAAEQNRPALALQCLEIAAQQAPNNPDVLNNYGNVLRQQWRLDDAKQVLERALRLTPRSINVLNNLGLLWYAHNEIGKAARYYRRALKLDRFHPLTWTNLGLLAVRLNDYRRAKDCFEKALQRTPRHQDALYNLAVCQVKEGCSEDAVETLRRLLEYVPEHHRGLLLLAETWIDLKQEQLAQIWLAAHLAIHPESAAIYHALGRIALMRRLPDVAEQALLKANELLPNDSRILCNLGVLYYHQKADYDQAFQYLERSLELEPNLSNSLLNMSALLATIGQHDRARMLVQQFADANPLDAGSWSVMLFHEQLNPASTPEYIAALHREYQQRYGSLIHPCRRKSNNRDPERKLKIGYVSADFYNHAVSYFIEPILRRNDPNYFEIHCFSNVQSEDFITERLRGFGHPWHDIKSLSDQRAARLIEETGIDILIDLSGHTAMNRLGIFMRKPAPIQVTTIGYVDTTGLDAMDYLLVGPWLIDESMEQFFSERIWRLPQTGAVYRPAEPAPDVALAPCLHNGYVTFGSYNRFNKINPAVIALWARILHAVPSSRLILEHAAYRTHSVCAWVEAQFRAAGVDMARVTLRVGGSTIDYLKAHGNIDIALDPFPYGGGTTTLDALWMGVPFVTISGDRLVSRMGLAILNILGHPEWVAQTPDDYVAIAADLAADPVQLAALRSQLRAEMLASPFFDYEGYMCDLEEAYREMWRRWCATNQST